MYFYGLLIQNLPCADFAEIPFGLQSVDGESQKHGCSQNKGLQDNRDFIESHYIK